VQCGQGRCETFGRGFGKLSSHSGIKSGADCGARMYNGRMKKFCLALLAVSSLACGWTPASARSELASKSCDYSNRCGEIGSGKKYADRSECLTKQNAAWLDALPSSTCEGKINAANLDVCLKQIDASGCSNIIDTLSVFSKCNSGAVCK
jgi:hypothetical protein